MTWPSVPKADDSAAMAEFSNLSLALTNSKTMYKTFFKKVVDDLAAVEVNQKKPMVSFLFSCSIVL